MQKSYIKKDKSSPFGVELLSSPLQWIGFFIICAFILMCSLTLRYYHYQDYMSLPYPKAINAQVIAQYTKSKDNKPPYQVLKLRDEKGAIFYTTSKEDIRDLSHRFVRIYGKPLECDFRQYLQSCFFISYRISLESQRDYRDTFRSWIASQHTENLLARLYQTLFIADFLPYDLRMLSNKLGVAHLIAISGFHLGILSIVIGGFLGIFYGWYHRHFSYRNKFYDIGFITLSCMFLYLLVLNFSPSFLRSFVMALVGFLMLYSGIRLLSFKFLLVVVCLCLVLFPHLFFSIGFVLSVMGVFFIFLFVKYITLPHDRFSQWVVLPIVFNTNLYFNMQLIVHWFFPYFTPLSVVSIPLTLIFVIFFPLSLILHLVGVGGVFDSVFIWALDLKLDAIEFYTPQWLFLCYIGLCFGSIWRKECYYLLCVVCAGFFAYLCWQFYASGSSLWGVSV
ncbi:ComEC/Rec2 family competence protein [Helicobacter sp. MIT 05-5293]|uniref:ComEC/Rec2 family competence protein n=1 Tax=Helicobacter sp. MIT 05-5293 TaxID=1548149 RepID=UPI000A768B78|nr:ComEC/Rec2 family competence protein [Helicobacter sp. MIT 05-5293]